MHVYSGVEMLCSRAGARRTGGTEHGSVSDSPYGLHPYVAAFLPHHALSCYASTQSHSTRHAPARPRMPHRAQGVLTKSVRACMPGRAGPYQSTSSIRHTTRISPVPKSWANQPLGRTVRFCFHFREGLFLYLGAAAHYLAVQCRVHYLGVQFRVHYLGVQSRVARLPLTKCSVWVPPMSHKVLCVGSSHVSQSALCGFLPCRIELFMLLAWAQPRRRCFNTRHTRWMGLHWVLME
jgi:hypothetical protein